MNTPFSKALQSMRLLLGRILVAAVVTAIDFQEAGTGYPLYQIKLYR